MSVHHFTVPVTPGIASIEGLDDNLMEFRWSETSKKVHRRARTYFEGKKSGWFWVGVGTLCGPNLLFPTLEQAIEGCRAWVAQEQRELEDLAV